MKHAFGIRALIGVGTEIIALGLNEIGGLPSAAQGVQITERDHQTRHGHAGVDRRADDLAQILLMLLNLERQVVIQQQIRQEDEQSVAPTQGELDERLSEIRREVPACVRQNCASDAGWKVFLATHGLTPERVASYLRYRVEILRFIEQRFRQGIRISAQEIETYYRVTLLPQYAPGEATPTLETVSPRIEEILLQQRVNVLFDDWLSNLRKQGEIEVLDPALESPTAGGKGGQ